jgi:hypothetical protein
MPLLAQESAQYKAVLDRNIGSIATIKVVLKSSMKFGGQGRDMESRLETQGIVVSKDGLLMLSNLPFSPEKLMSMFGGGGEEEGDRRFGMKVTPTDFKVIFGTEDKEYAAYLVATDSKLDLAFIKIEKPEGRKFVPIEFNKPTVPTVGQGVVMVSRLSKGYDYAPYFASSRISGEIRKPRKAWMLDNANAAPAMPIYTATGQVIGITAMVASGVKDDSDGGMFGGFSSNSEMGRVFIVPATVVQGVLDQAKIRAVTVAQQRAKNKPKSGKN